MQRLFSMFPAGVAGVALLCLRISVILTLFLGSGQVEERSAGLTWVAAMLGFSLGIGFATPVCASICWITGVCLLFRVSGAMLASVAASALVAFALALLGPGAYSVDARLFGRRRVIFRNRDGTRDD